MRKLTIAVGAFLLFFAVAAGGWWYWHLQQTIQQNVRLLKLAVTKDFNDPESARFRALKLQTFGGTMRNRLRLLSLKFLKESTPEQVLSVVQYLPEDFVLCGEVNAKNGFGAYVGYRRFYVGGTSGREPTPFLQRDGDDSFADSMCEITSSSVLYIEPGHQQ